MAIDTKQFKDKIKQQNPNINLVPLLDVIFTIMIFLLVVLSQTPTSDLTHYPQDQISAKLFFSKANKFNRNLRILFTTLKWIKKSNSEWSRLF